MSAPVWRIAVGALLVTIGACYYAAARAGSQFFADDFLYLLLSKNDRITPGWFFIDNYGHFAPITRFEYLLLERTVGLDYAVGALFPVFFVVVTAASLLWVARTLIGRKPISLAIVAFTCTSILMMRTTLWFASGIHVLGACAAYTLSVAGFIAYSKRPRRSFLVCSVGALVIGLLIQERMILTIGYLILIRYLVGYGLEPSEIRRRPRAWARQVRTDWKLWTPYVVVLGAYLVYRFGYFKSEPAPGSVQDGAVLLGSGLQRTFFPALAGTTTPSDSGWFPLAALAGMGVFTLIAIWLCLYRRQTWRVLIFFALTYAANMAILAAGRLALAGAVYQSRDLQYFVDGLLCVPLALVLGIGCLPRRNPVPRRTPVLSAFAMVSCTVAVIVLAATSITWSRVIRHNNQTEAHFFLNRAVEGLGAYSGDFDLLRMQMPLDVIPDFVAPYNDQPSAMALDKEIAAKIDPSSPSKVALSSVGDVLALTSVTAVQMSLGIGSVVGDGGAVVTENPTGAQCINGTPGSYASIDLAEPIHSDELFFGLQYSIPTPTDIRVMTTNAAVTVYNAHRTRLTQGATASRFDRVDGSEIKQVFLLFEDGVSNLCLGSLWLGSAAVRRPDGSCRVLDHNAREARSVNRCDDHWPFVGSVG